MNPCHPFVFSTEQRLVRLTGRTARNLEQLLHHLRKVSGASIFYHTHHLYLAHHFEKPLFYNDFAIWVSEALLDQILAERLAAIDLLEFATLRDLRERLIETIESHLASSDGRVREAPPGDEFYFNESQSFIMPTGLVAHDVPEFFATLPEVTNVSLFFHFFEARLRLERLTNDFSAWLGDCGETRLAEKINALNPYVMTLEQLKRKIILLGRSRNGTRNGRKSA